MMPRALAKSPTNKSCSTPCVGKTLARHGVNVSMPNIRSLGTKYEGNKWHEGFLST
jgi:hypothetical protein